MSFEDTGDNLIPTTVIDEETEFKTNIEFTEIMDGDCLTRILKKFTKGYKTQTILSMLSSSLTLISLSLPFTIQSSGLFLSLGLCVVIFLFTFFSMYILLEVILKTNATNYHQLIYAFIGKKIAFVYDIINFIYLFSILVIHLIFNFLIISNILLEFGVENTNSFVAKLFILLIPFIIQIPLSLLKKFNQMRLFTMICAGMIIIYYVITLILLFVNFGERQKEIEFAANNFNWLYANAIFSILFGTHSYIFSIFGQFILKTKKRSTDVIIISHSIEIVLFIIFSFIGYFYSTHSQNLLASIIQKERSIPILIVQIIFVLLIQFLIPIQMTQIKEGIRNTLANAALANQPLSLPTEIIITVIVLLLGNICVYLTQEIKLFIGISGGICSGIICFVLPYFAYCKVFEEANYKHYIGFIVMLVTILVSATTTVHSFTDLISGK